METVIVAKLVADPTVSGLVGSRIEPQLVAQGAALPYIAYSIVSGGPMNTLGGTTTTTQVRIQLDIYATTYAGVKTLAAAVAAVLSGWRDLTTDPRIQMMHLLNEIDDVENPSDDSAAAAYRVIQDYQVDHDPAP